MEKKLAIRKNDQVEVIAGKDKGKIGRVLKVDSKAGRITIESVNVLKKHIKPAGQQPGSVTEREFPIHYSNALLMCTKCNRGVRHRKETVDLGNQKTKKVRVCKRCSEKIDAA